MKKLATQGRLVRFEAAVASAPAQDPDWCAEALKTHRIQPLTGGVIVTQQTKACFSDETLVAPINRLPTTPWWATRSPSIRLARNLAAYQQHLDPILRCANSIQFIDPHLDPAKRGYREFADLLVRAGMRRTPLPDVIEIHRVCYEGSGRGRGFPDLNELELRFRKAYSSLVRDAGLLVDLFVWDDFHDRYLISNLVGISMQNGFDTTKAANSITGWTRLGRDDRDDVQREFDPGSKRHVLKRRFKLP